MGFLITVAAVLAMLVSVLLIPIGLPGLWLIVVLVMVLVLAGSLSWTFGLVVAALASAAELGEFLVLRRFAREYGGSRKAFWGAVGGGMAGLFVGLPIPLIGPLVTAFLGTFIGAGLVTYLETRSIETSTRVGWGSVLARTVAVGLKIATALVLTAAVGVALIR